MAAMREVWIMSFIVDRMRESFSVVLNLLRFDEVDDCNSWKIERYLYDSGGGTNLTVVACS